MNSVGILSDRLIRQEISNGNIILFDPDRDCSSNIQNCSVDVTLGDNVIRHINNNDESECINPWRYPDSEKYWNVIEKASVISTEKQALELGLNIGDKYIIINPSELILAHTREFIGGKNNISTMMKARSSIGRSGLCICNDAGFGDLCYFNRWTLEIRNNSKSSIILPVGSRIGQIIFFYTGPSDTIYHGKYQNHDNLQDVVANWNPEMMIPKLYLDNR